jgi:hypothetical protein
MSLRVSRALVRMEFQVCQYHISEEFELDRLLHFNRNDRGFDGSNTRTEPGVMPRRPRSAGYPPRTGVVDGSSSVPTQPASAFPNQHMAMLSTSMRGYVTGLTPEEP